ncbi:MAG: urea ABC transporter ATP-binding subunit UrtE [Chloroflexi bacterium]|nr:urea ABC transporter ATP-binding subunit UrtE [Chloroflexota bacterium]
MSAGEASGQSLLSVESLTAGYGESQILTELTFSVPAAGAVCLLGRNGVGKTTTLKSIVGLIRPRSGRVLFDGKDVTTKGPHERARLGIGYVPQGRGIFPHLSVFENLLMGFEANPKMSAGNRGTTLDEMYTLFPVLAEMRGRAGGMLSGGQQQQLAIARALVARPKLLLLDEPAEGIQPNIVHLIEEAVAALPARGVAVLLVEQFVDFAVAVCDQYYMVERGTVVAQGPTTALGQEVIDEYLAV